MDLSPIDRETAEHEFERIAKSRRIETDVNSMSEDDRKEFLELKEPLMEALCEGRLVVDEHGQPQLKLLFPVEIKDKKWESLTFHRPTGAMLTASDGFKEEDRGARMHAMLGSVCKTSRGMFDLLDWVDHKVCASLFKLFLA